MKISATHFVDWFWVFGVFCSGLGSVIGKISRSFGVCGFLWDRLLGFVVFKEHKKFTNFSTLVGEDFLFLKKQAFMLLCLFGFSVLFRYNRNTKVA